MKLRSVRIPDEVWQPALDKASKDSVSLSEVIRQALIEYAAKTPTR